MFIFNNLILGIARVFERFPFWFLYLKSNAYFFFIYYIFQYRRKVVSQNLKNSFPEKTESELKTISKNYYRHLCDLFFEVVKSNRMDAKELLDRIQFKNESLIHKLSKKHSNILFCFGHQGNWEWLGSYLQLRFNTQNYAVVKPLSNASFDRYLSRIRTRFGLKLIPFKQTPRFLYSVKKDPAFLLIAADQSPAKADQKQWLSFLNQDTAFHPGLGKIATKLMAPVVFLEIKKTSRSYYEINPTLITEHPNQSKQIEILEKYVSLLEESIIKYPAHWLWSHRRWKHTKSNK